MNTVTYITNANSFTRYLIPDGCHETIERWFKESLPGDEIKELREALIDAVIRMNDEDRALLVANGFTINTIPLAYTEADEARVFGEYDVFDERCESIYKAIAAECKSQGLTEGYTSTWATLTVLKKIGGNVEKFLH